MTQPKTIKWKLITKKVSELKPYHKNPRNITEQGLKDLKQSVDKFGLAEPIVINTDNVIIGGHGRVLTLKANGIKECDCYIPNRKLNDKEVEELNIRLNKNIAGTWDFDILANEFETNELLFWGFNERELGGLSIEKINEMEEWKESNIGDFEIADKMPKVVITFQTAKKREKFVTDWGLEVGHKQAGTWSINL